MGKYLILDKSVLEATSTFKLEKFVKNHFLILPDDLYYECATTTDNKEILLDRFRSIILSGGYICTSCKDIVKKEARTLQPYSFLVNLTEVSAVRKTFQKNSRPYSQYQAQKRLEEELSMARMIINKANGFIRELIRNNPELLKEVRKCDSSKSKQFERLQEWIKFIDSQDIHKAAKKLLYNITNIPEKYCLSEKWISWHYIRLFLSFGMEIDFLRQNGAESSDITIEHHLQDLKYVTLLSHADGLLTKDSGCLSLAKVAFPDKDVFSSLDEVPASYLFHWN